MDGMPPKRQRRGTNLQRNTPSKHAAQKRKGCSKARGRSREIICLGVSHSGVDSDSCSSGGFAHKPATKPKSAITTSPESMIRRGLMSESDSDDDVTEICSEASKLPSLTAHRPDKELCQVTSSESESDGEDIYSINYEAQRKVVYANVCRSLEAFKKEMPIESSDEDGIDRMSPACSKDISDSGCNDSVIITRSMQSSSPVLLDVSNAELPRGRKVQAPKKTKEALKKIREMSNRNMNKSMEMNDSLNSSDIRVLSSDDEEVNPELILRVRWGTSYIKFSLRQKEKFVKLYQQLAEKFGVGVSQIILTVNDRIISINSCPGDYSISVVDTIEGGFCVPEASEASNISQGSTNPSNPDIITLKVQNNRKKGTVMFPVHKYDKFSVLMEKYASHSGVTLNKLRFEFDGEELNPQETPIMLDLDGGECIDVYERK